MKTSDLHSPKKKGKGKGKEKHSNHYNKLLGPTSLIHSYIPFLLTKKTKA